MLKVSTATLGRKTKPIQAVMLILRKALVSAPCYSLLTGNIFKLFTALYHTYRKYATNFLILFVVLQLTRQLAARQIND